MPLGFDSSHRLFTMGAVALALVLTSGPARAATPESVTGSSGSFSQVIRVDVPAYRGLEPRLALAYSSQAGDGFVGVGWGLVGFSVIQRASPGLGSPHFDASDVFVLDGGELLPCPPGSASPSCATGGSHTTKSESYLRIRFDAAANAWTVWARNGTRTALTPVYQTASGTLSWGQTSTIDPHDNAVSYTWSCEGGDCYPDLVTFGPYSITLFREDRADVLSFATGSDGSLRQMRLRLRSVARTGPDCGGRELERGEELHPRV